jgi:hypothetical protein
MPVMTKGLHEHLGTSGNLNCIVSTHKVKEDRMASQQYKTYVQVY